MSYLGNGYVTEDHKNFQEFDNIHRAWLSTRRLRNFERSEVDAGWLLELKEWGVMGELVYNITAQSYLTDKPMGKN